MIQCCSRTPNPKTTTSKFILSVFQNMVSPAPFSLQTLFRSDRSHGLNCMTLTCLLLLPGSRGIFVPAWTCVSNLLSWSCEHWKLECSVFKKRLSEAGITRREGRLSQEGKERKKLCRIPIGRTLQWYLKNPHCLFDSNNFTILICWLNFSFCEVIYVTVSPLCDLILKQCLAVLQWEVGQLQEVNAPSLCTNAEQVTWPQQEKDCYPCGTEERNRSRS